MARKIERRQYWVVDKQVLDDAGVNRVLDMMRYDGAQVVNNGPQGFWMFVSEQQTAPTVERWRSHGIAVPWQMRMCTHESLALDEARRFADVARSARSGLEKAGVISRYFVDDVGWRASEAAMTISEWSPRKVERVYNALTELRAQQNAAYIPELTATQVQLVKEKRDRLEREIELV